MANIKEMERTVGPMRSSYGPGASLRNNLTLRISIIRYTTEKREKIRSSRHKMCTYYAWSNMHKIRHPYTTPGVYIISYSHEKRE